MKVVVGSTTTDLALQWCLESLARQSVAPEAVVVISESQVVAEFEEKLPLIGESALEDLWRSDPTTTAFVSGSVTVDRDWIEKLGSRTLHQDVGAIGGRVLVLDRGRTTARWFEGPVARLSRAGRFRSHLTDIPATSRVEFVDILHESNLCCRDELALKVLGSVRHLDLSDALALGVVAKASGLRLLYDSEIVAAMHSTEQSPEDRTREVSRLVGAGLTKELPVARLAGFLPWFLLVGDRASPGALMAPYFLARRGEALRRFAAGLGGKLAGSKEGMRARRGRD